MIVTLINNKFVEKKDAKISILGDISRGYGVFETMRTYGNKKLFRTEEHINRLFQSAKKINLRMKYDEAKILNMLEKVIKKSPKKLQRIKIIATSKEIIIISQALKIDKTMYRGVSCMSIECQRALPEVKSISYLASYLSHEEAVKKGHFEAILTDEKGEVFEGAYSNLFWFEGKTLCTREDKILKGITRKAIIEISHYKVKFKTIKLSSLLKKKEIFITSSIKGVVPVTKLNKNKIGTGKPGQKTLEIMQKFKEIVET